MGGFGVSGAGKIPLWKIPRELRRLKEQLAWQFEKRIAPSRTRAYDASRSQMRRSAGRVPNGGKIAAILIFAPDALPESTLLTLQSFTAAGFAPLVISNGPLRDKSRAALLDLSFYLVERPNLGYDFGGYREAVATLNDLGVLPDELLIMNDSVWLIPQLFAPFLARLRATGCDLSGGVLRGKNNILWIESYFYRISGAAFQSDVFQRFWADYRLINSKFAVIRIGERDFSVKMKAGGLTIGAMANSDFCALIETLPTEALAKIIDFSNPKADRAPELTAGRAQLLEAAGAGVASEAWTAQARHHIRDLLAAGNAWNSQFPYASAALIGYPFVKKSREPINFGWRQAVLRADEAGAFPALPQILKAEMVEKQASGATDAPRWITKKAP